MSYKWKPNASQRAAFCEKMKNEDEKLAYLKRKESKKLYANWKDKDFVPTKFQYEYALKLKSNENISETVNNACNQIMYGFSCNEKINHFFIHIINSIERGEKLLSDINFED
jgi:hypothetical protein